MEENIWNDNFLKIEHTKVNKTDTDNAVHDISKIFDFIRKNNLKDVKFKYEESTKTAVIKGIKDNDIYITKIFLGVENYE